MSRIGSLFLTLAVAFPALAQRNADDPPIVGRPADFSNIVGKYTIEVSAEPLQVLVEEPITLKVRIAGTGPAKYQPLRKHLQILPKWEEDFYVENVPDEDRVAIAEKIWEFVYRLRPKHSKVNAIDDVKICYYDPAARKFVHRYATRIDNIRVQARPDAAAAIVTPTPFPESFYRLEGADTVMAQARAPLSDSGFALALALGVPPLAAALGLLAWRRMFPGDAVRRARNRSQAAGNALLQLKYAGGRPWKVVQHYLKERLDFAVDDPTPVDVADFLKRRGFAKEHCALAQAFFQACDALRYTTAPGRAHEVHVAATRLIQALESDPCAR